MKAAIKDPKTGKPVFLVTKSEYERTFTQLVDLINQLTTTVKNLNKKVDEVHLDVRGGIEELSNQFRAGFAALDTRLAAIDKRVEAIDK